MGTAFYFTGATLLYLFFGRRKSRAAVLAEAS
jgi:hypothetical protein